jgi:hypothetical protein
MDDTSLWAGITLVISNFLLAPVIAKCVRMRLFMEACIITVLFIASYFYHMCQAEFFCVDTVENHQIMDHFFVYSTFVWMALFIVNTEIVPKVCVFIIAQSFLLPTIIRWTDSWALAGVIIVVVLLILVTIALYNQNAKFDTLDVFCALFLVIVGLVFFALAGDPGEKSYPGYHSLWHTTSMSSLYFVVTIRDGEGELCKLFRNIKESFN